MAAKADIGRQGEQMVAGAHKFWAAKLRWSPEVPASRYSCEDSILAVSARKRCDRVSNQCGEHCSADFPVRYGHRRVLPPKTAERIQRVQAADAKTSGVHAA